MSAEQVLEFWLDTVGPQGWYEPSDALDQTIRDRFMSDWLNIVSGKNGMWLTYPSGTFGLYHCRRSIFAKYVSEPSASVFIRSHRFIRCKGGY